MASTAASRHPAQNPEDPTRMQLSEEDVEKLQEIHELINLMFRELPMRAQNGPPAYALPALPVVPYTHAYFQFPWGVAPFGTPPGF